jgi:Ni/Co efflux regulator RcnB
MKRAVLATIAISLFAGSVAMADSRHDRNDRDNRYSHRYDHADHRDHNRRDWRNDRDRDHRDHRRYDHRDDHRYNRWDNRRYDRRDDHRYNHYYDRRYDNRRYRSGYYGYSRPYHYSHRSWHRGGYLPVAYYGYPYRIHSYRSYGLYGPPRGYYWARVDGDAVLAAIATGLIIDAVYDAFY